MKAGCYTLDLYCDHPDHPRYGQSQYQFTGETFAECRRKAKADGWTVGSWTTEAADYCPDCSKRAKARTP